METKSTKTVIPWVIILKEYNASNDRRFICHCSKTFSSLWHNPEIRLEIKKEARKFLDKTKNKYFNVYQGNNYTCLFYFNYDFLYRDGVEMSVHAEDAKIKQQFLEYMVEKSKPKTKYSYFKHSAAYCFGNPGGPTFLIRRENKTNDFCEIYYNEKRITKLFDTWACEYHLEEKNWVPADEKTIRRAKRVNREVKYLYYRHRASHLFGNPDSLHQYIMRYEPGKREWWTYSYAAKTDSGLNNFRFDLWEKSVKEGDWIPATKESIKLAKKVNK